MSYGFENYFINFVDEEDFTEYYNGDINLVYQDYYDNIRDIFQILITDYIYFVSPEYRNEVQMRRARKRHLRLTGRLITEIANEFKAKNKFPL